MGPEAQSANGPLTGCRKEPKIESEKQNRSQNNVGRLEIRKEEKQGTIYEASGSQEEWWITHYKDCMMTSDLSED